MGQRRDGAVTGVWGRESAFDDDKAARPEEILIPGLPNGIRSTSIM